jgi:hypothetical protein
MPFFEPRTGLTDPRRALALGVKFLFTEDNHG